MYALFQEDVLNTLESDDNHLFSERLLGNFGKCESCLHLAILYLILHLIISKFSRD